MPEQRRLEISFQGELGAHADRLAAGSRIGAEKPADSEPVQAAIVPRKEDARAGPLLIGQRTGHGKELRRAYDRGIADQGTAGKAQAAVSGSVGVRSLASRRSSIFSPRDDSVFLRKVLSFAFIVGSHRADETVYPLGRFPAEGLQCFAASARKEPTDRRSGEFRAGAASLARGGETGKVTL